MQNTTARRTTIPSKASPRTLIVGSLPLAAELVLCAINYPLIGLFAVFLSAVAV